MGTLRFRRRISLLPGFTLNLSKRGASVSAGVRGLHTTFGRRRLSTIGLPGSGWSYTVYHHARRHARRHGPGLLTLLAIGWALWAILH